MAIDLIKESIECEQLLGENTADTVIKGEYVIPDTHPDVYRILMLDTKPSILTKEVMQDKVYLEGQIQFNVLYLAREDEEKSGVHNVAYTAKFSNSIELSGANRSMPCEAECYIEHMEPVIINERKISIEGIIKLKSALYKNYNFEIVKDMRGLSDVQVLKNTTSVDKIAGNVEGEMVAKSHMQVPMDKPQIGNILKCDVNMHKKEAKLLEGKAMISGFAHVELLYRGKDTNDICYMEDDVLVNKEIDMEGINSYMDSSTDFRVDDMIYDVKEDDMGERRIFDLEALVKTNTKVMSKEHMDIIEDVYSPTMIMDMEKRNYDLNVMHGHASNETIVKGNIELADDMPKPVSIIMPTASVCVTDKKLVEDKVIVEGLLRVEVLYRTNEDEKSAFVVQDELPFTASVEVPGAKINMQCAVKVSLENVEAAIEANTIGIKAIVALYGRVNYNTSKEFLVNVIPNEAERPKKRASITIYVVQGGDTFWKIAKRYNTTTDALMFINEIEGNDSLKPGMKLIIPGRALI